jgi:hypothetical protein
MLVIGSSNVQSHERQDSPSSCGESRAAVGALRGAKRGRNLAVWRDQYKHIVD